MLLGSLILVGGALKASGSVDVSSVGIRVDGARSFVCDFLGNV